MRLVKAAAFVLVAPLLGVVGWTAYRSGWHPLPSPRAPTSPAQNAEPPVAEYREVQSGPDGQTGSLLTINHTGQVTVQTIPLGPGSKWMSPPADSKPPGRQFRIVELRDQTSALAAKRAPRAVSSIDSTPLTIREALLEITAGKLDPTPLSITYDDMHGLWGGLTLTICGDGNVEQKAVKEKAGTPSLVSQDSILMLIRLLLKEKAWQQREPQRAPKSDESRARLVIQYGKLRSEIWEWYNDLDRNQRLGKVRDLMKTIVSK